MLLANIVSVVDLICGCCGPGWRVDKRWIVETTFTLEQSAKKRRKVRIV